MKLSRTLFLLAAASVLAGYGVAASRSAGDAQKLLQRDAEWADVAAAGKDVEKTISYWSDDAVLIPQGEAIIEGKAAIRAYVTDCFKIPGFRIHWKSEKAVFSPDGKLAYMQSVITTTAPGPNGSPTTSLSRGVLIWRLEPDGQWRCVVDIWNDPPPAPAAAK